MKQISVIISSLRPEALELTIDSMAMHSDLIDVVVVSPWAPKKRDYVKHVPVPPPPPADNPQERELAGELSLSKKINLGISQASSEYIVYHNDDLHFRPGWAPALLAHMGKYKINTSPYLAAFHLACKGEIVSRHTVFGLLYANHGCISKQDLNRIGGFLYEERMRTEYVDPDLSMRVWAAGGRVGICHEVIIDTDSYTKNDPKKPDKLCTPYKWFWAVSDGAAFFDLWFWKYFWLFFSNYRNLSRKLASSDGVLPKKFHKSGAFVIFAGPLLKLFYYTITRQKEKVNITKNRLCRLINRRWFTLDYELPYHKKEVVRKTALL